MHCRHNKVVCRQYPPPPTAFLPNTNHHHYSPITQPCHKDTALNQQCCDNEHKDRRGERDTTPHRTSPPTTNTATQDKRGTRTMREEQTMRRRAGQCKMPDPIQRRGHRTHHHIRHSIGPQGKRQGGRQHADGDTDIQRGVSNTAALHSPCHPPPQRHPTIHDGPTLHHDEGGARRGYPTTRTAQTYTHHPHATRLAVNSARHDSSTRQHCSGMSGARATSLHRAGQQQHTSPPFHTPRRMDTIHSSTRLLSLVHVHTVSDQR